MKIAIISGASSGIGKEFAKQLDNKNLDEIWLIARNDKKLNEVSESLKTPSKVISLDLSLQSSYDNFKGILEYAKPDIKYLINAAGFGKYGKDIPLDQVNKMIDLNIKGLVNITYLSIPYMHKGSKLVQMASIAGYLPLYNFTVYSASKAFVLSFANSLHYELKEKGIKVIAITPCWVKTNFDKTANVNFDSKSLIYSSVSNAKDVVKKGLRDVKFNKLTSTYGFIPKAYKAATKVLPKRVTMSIWKQLVIHDLDNK